MHAHTHTHTHTHTDTNTHAHLCAHIQKYILIYQMYKHTLPLDLLLRGSLLLGPHCSNQLHCLHTYICAGVCCSAPTALASCTVCTHTHAHTHTHTHTTHTHTHTHTHTQTYT